jgi:hypothetical protein
VKFTKAELNKFSPQMHALLLHEADLRLRRAIVAMLAVGYTIAEIKDRARQTEWVPDPDTVDL